MSTVRWTNILATLVLASLFIYTKPAQSQQRSCVITNEGATVCGKLTKQTSFSAKQPAQSFGQREEVGDFVYVLRDCKRLDTNIQCVFTILNKGKETLKAAYAAAFELVDSNGKSYRGSIFEIGSESGNYSTGTISPGIDYAAKITFESVPGQITRFPLLRGEFNEPGQKQVHFRNISIAN
jgi:hypothetical protein